MIGTEYPLNAVLHPRKEAAKISNKAVACHANQGGGHPRQDARPLANVVEGMEKLVDIFIDALAGESWQLRPIDLLMVHQNSRKDIVPQTSYLIDMARAETLSFRGRTWPPRN